MKIIIITLISITFLISCSNQEISKEYCDKKYCDNGLDCGFSTKWNNCIEKIK